MRTHHVARVADDHMRQRAVLSPVAHHLPMRLHAIFCQTSLLQSEHSHDRQSASRASRCLPHLQKMGTRTCSVSS